MTTAQTRDALREAPETMTEAASRLLCLRLARTLYKAMPIISCRDTKILAMAKVLREVFDKVDGVIEDAKGQTRVAKADLTEARALAQRSGEERDRAVAALNRIAADAGTGLHLRRDMADAHQLFQNILRAARSVIEPTEGEDA